jgi:small subunit ribosomal protein S16
LARSAATADLDRKRRRLPNGVACGGLIFDIAHTIFFCYSAAVILKIRRQRTGRINDPSYRLVVVEHTRAPRSGGFLEKLGSYHAKTGERVLNAERISYWMSVGAQASDTVHNMLISAGIVKGKKRSAIPPGVFAKIEKAKADLSAEASAKAEAASKKEEEAPAAPAKEEASSEATEAETKETA